MRAIFGTGSVEVHFSSPHEMSHELAPCLKGEPLRLPADPSVQPGPRRQVEVIIHVPWLGRRLRLRGTVEIAAPAVPPGPGSSESAAPPQSNQHPYERPPVLLSLADGAHDTRAHLAEVVGKVVSGAILEPDPGESSPEKRIQAMTTSLRALLASKAGPAERLVLARDPDPRVLDALLRNPSFTLEEARRLAARTTLTQSLFHHFVRHPVWMNDEMMRITLARNPRLPEFIAESVLPLLSLPALKGLAESPNVTSSTRRVAVRILASRGIVVAARRGL
jgi:hypothetical protein